MFVQPLTSNHRLRTLLWLCALVAAFFVVPLGLALLGRLVHVAPLVSAALGQVGILAVALFFAYADGAGIRSLGLGTAWKSYDAGIAAGLVAFHYFGSFLTGAVLLVTGVLKSEAVESSDAGQLLSSLGNFAPGPFFLGLLALVVLVGFGEEMLFRGYIITRLERLGLPAWGCILVSALVFGLAHWPGYGLVLSLSKALWLGIPSGAYFYYRRNLGPLVLAHAFIDFSGLGLAYVVSRFLPFVS